MASSRSPLSPPDIGERIRAQFGSDVKSADEVFGHAVAKVDPGRYREIASFLRDEPDLDFNFFDFLTAVDFRPKGGGFEVVTQVYSTRHNHSARLKVECDAEDPRCPTLQDVWPGANWCEREAWELFGIVFEGHPHLVKLVLPEQFEGFPLRKDFPLMTREVKPWPGEAEGVEGVIAALLAASETGNFINDLFDSFWLVLALKVAMVLGLALTAPLAVGYMEHKVLAHMQHRLGPMYAGRFHGWAQLIADGVKFIQKEDVIPKAADPWVFTLAPAVALVPYIALFLVIPFDNTIFAENLDVGIFYTLAITAISVIGVLMAGWASANKFSLIGALRAAAQLIAYELPMILAAVAVVMQAGTLSMVGITEAQHPHWYVLTQPVAFGVFLIASLAELTRPPFDMPVADSEIIFGAYTEYTGLKFAFFLLSEYAGIVAFSAIAAVLFLGGYLGPPFIGGLLPGPIWMSAKVGALAFFIVWLRATYPRLREDQLQRFSWVVLIPLMLLNIMVTATLKVLVK